MRSRWGTTTLLRLAIAVLALGGVAAADDGTARVTGVTPARTGNLVVAHLTTAGLPGERLVQSMRSGLTSAIELELVLLDEQRQVLGNGRLDLELAFDLWEEVFSVRGHGPERRFRDLEELRGYLRELRAIPIAPLDRVPPEMRCMIRVGLLVHAIAPAQKQQVGDVIAGDPHTTRAGQDRQEASVSLGRLIRLFYKGGARRDGVLETSSAWFVREELRDAAH